MQTKEFQKIKKINNLKTFCYVMLQFFFKKIIRFINLSYEILLIISFSLTCLFLMNMPIRCKIITQLRLLTDWMYGTHNIQVSLQCIFFHPKAELAEQACSGSCPIFKMS